MRGVLISDQWIERLGTCFRWEAGRARRRAWPQVRRVVVDGERVTVELWDSTREQLPEVGTARARHPRRGARQA